jgi:hypothetical protein
MMKMVDALADDNNDKNYLAVHCSSWHAITRARQEYQVQPWNTPPEIRSRNSGSDSRFIR